ncbi:hypothetical protein C7M61_003116 [Candidozyma pseudohaemuli]|uniref:Uncharacterized protein n=1 Tax=Candidozyma pseudohaemuli TaxID=418784 RepID=A0A2P7YPI4_9ASCO|nr:hypothetical protein C7M61_003116 [[Candida] pseudohaemulonii]PSK37869.1 hypothetical protein C7M61_003116 [[Candida] pseudohaemulonii]
MNAFTAFLNATSSIANKAINATANFPNSTLVHNVFSTLCCVSDTAEEATQMPQERQCLLQVPGTPITSEPSASVDPHGSTQDSPAIEPTPVVMPGTFPPEEAQASSESSPDSSPEESTPEESAPSPVQRAPSPRRSRQPRATDEWQTVVSQKRKSPSPPIVITALVVKPTSIKQLRKPKQQTEGRYKEPFYDVSKQITQANIFAFLGE